MSLIDRIPNGGMAHLAGLLAVMLNVLSGPGLTGADLITRQLPEINPFITVEEFPPIAARHIRFIILETNGKPPSLDEVEVFTAEEEPRNVRRTPKNGPVGKL